jgi:uncharacterized protein (DUF2249 family)
MTLDELFNKCIPEPNSGCWLWTGWTHRQGYGCLRVDGKTKLAHRVAYEAAYGPFPATIDVCHKCDVTGCINPDHLFLGTHQDNMVDRAKKGKCNFSKLTQRQIAKIIADPRPSHLVAQDYDVTPTAITWQRRKANGPKWRRAAHLTKEQIQQIIADQRLYKDIANDYGVSIPCICKHKRAAQK